MEDKPYTSKTKRNECKNEGCEEQRQHGSSRCLKCSKKFGKLKKSPK